MSDTKTLNPPVQATPEAEDRKDSEVEVFAVHGAEPEVQAYAMAKYSRSALSMKESLREISEQKAEKFLNTFYFQYGHRSIADLAHVALAVEKLSMLAAITLVDEQRWDGQERSTRYQDYKKASYYVPSYASSRERNTYRDAIEALFAAYEQVSEKVFLYFVERTPKPADLKQDAYERTLRARAFDVSRYLLPLATNTSLGQIVNARTLETQISRLLSDSHSEVRSLGEKLKSAAKEPAWNVNSSRYRGLVAELHALDPDLGDRAEALLLREVRVSPTLVKYAEPNGYQLESRRELQQAASELMGRADIETVPFVELLDDDPLEIELATTLLYERCHYAYRQIRERVAGAGETFRNEIIQLGTAHRGPHDELLRAFSAGQGFRFDILQDIGGYRDMHRHRRCVQIGQAFTLAHGYEMLEEITASGAADRYQHAMSNMERNFAALGNNSDAEALENAHYVIPLAYRKRTLFKMDLAEVVYISELRSKPEGHISYRRVAHAMYEAAVKKHPALASMFRVSDIQAPVDLLKR